MDEPKRYESLKHFVGVSGFGLNAFYASLSFIAFIVVMANLAPVLLLRINGVLVATQPQVSHAFASKARYQIINDGGMVYQFLGDAVIALFGLPERLEDDAQRAFQCAKALIDIGASVENEWQRRIDHVQESCGIHVSMTAGDLQWLSLRPFSRAHMGAIADSINLAARLNSVSGPGEIVVSNVLYQRLPSHLQRGFAELEPLNARNIGRVRAWKLDQASGN